MILKIFSYTGEINPNLDPVRMQFFSRPDNQYWKGSLLERYTLSQLDENTLPPMDAAGGLAEI